MEVNKLGFLIGGGTAGTLARYALTQWLNVKLGTAFPYATLFINLSGCFLIGIFAAWARVKLSMSPEAHALLMAGFCGAFTTFSAFMLEFSTLLQEGFAARAWLYVLASVALGFFSLQLGLALGKSI